MKQNISIKLILGLMVTFSALAAVFLPTSAFSKESQNLRILTITELQPGDLINFSGGWGAFLGAGEFGHTGMYLGKNPKTGEKVFLDFTTSKKGRKKTEFHGRISSAEEFLTDNIKHEEFSVYRFDGPYKSPDFQERLFDSATDIARDKTYGNFTDCASAATRALSDATGSSIIIFNPNKIPDEFKLVALSVNIKDALAEKISQNEHDKRLMATLGAMAQYVCTGQASVTQEELDNLPRPYQEDVVLGNHSYGVGGDCYLPLYQYLAKGGADAETVKRMSTHTPPVEPLVARPIPQPLVARPIPPTPFANALPRLKEFAITACSDPSQIFNRDRILTGPYDVSYREYDDNLARELKSGLGDCPQQLFDYLIANIRASQWRALFPEAIRDMVAAYSRAPDTQTDNIKLPQNNGREPPKSRDHDEVWRRINPIIGR